MYSIVNLYSDKIGEISRFLSNFYNSDNLHIENELKWEKKYDNSIELADIIGTFIDNNDKYKINMWISMDEGLFINVTDSNADSIIKYLYERYPY
ncbi:MAG: hypothetical protein HFJ53_06950 [Clostridia bacterium]|jgi:hypothetical protein|nr:hypothetical protein [Clostridia bacterium]